MKVVVTIQHPAHVHFFKHVVTELREGGHEVHVFAREKDVTAALLSASGLSFEMLAGPARTLPGLAFEQLRYEYRLFRRARRLDPDVMTSIGGLAVAHVSSLVGARSVVFTDTELASNWLVAPFADAICTPRTFPISYGSAHIRYDGFQELAYLTPARFAADTDRLCEFDVRPDEWYAVLRFSDMNAHHDLGHRGLSDEAKADLVSLLSAYGPVYLSVEGDDFHAVSMLLDRGATRLPVPPELLHDLLANASIVVTDSATTATEAGVLGTPTIRAADTAGDDDLQNFRILGDRYGLVYSTADEDDVIESARAFAENDAAKQTWRRRRDELLSECIDVTDFAVSVLLSVAAGETPPDTAAEVRHRA